MMFNRAAQDAEQGAFEDPDEVATTYGLGPGESNALTRRSLQSRKQIESNWVVAQHAADTLNKHSHLKNEIIPQAQKAVNDLGWAVLPSTREQKAQAQGVLKNAQDAVTALYPLVCNFNKQPRLGELISFDPDQNAYVPAIAPPSWKSSTPMPPPADSQSPAGYVQTSGNTGWYKPAAAPGVAPAQTSGTGNTGRKYSPWVYNRVNELNGQGLDPATALNRALGEEKAMFGQ
jgi:hypothetical protein